MSNLDGIKKIFSKLPNWYFSKKALPYWGVLLFDTIIVFSVSFLVHILVHGVSGLTNNYCPLITTLAIYLVFYLIAFKIFHTYSGILRFSSFLDLMRIFFAMLLGSSMIFVTKHFFDFDSIFVPIAANELVITMLVATFAIWMSRVGVKYLYDVFYVSSKGRRVFIYGVRDAGVAIAKSIRNQKPSKYILMGFVADEKSLAGMRMMGVKIWANDDTLIQQMKKSRTETLLVSPKKNTVLRENKDMIERLTDAGIKIYMIPEAVEWKEDNSVIEYQHLKEVEVEDLLPRDKIDINLKGIKTRIAGRKIMITGSAGSIGSEIVRQIAEFNPSVMLLIDQAETPQHDIRIMMEERWPDIEAHTITANICNDARMENIFKTFKPEYLFHAAAYKHVPMMEDYPSESIHNNVYGTKVIADLAVKYGVEKFVMISTDKAVNPTNVMGCSKRICEIYVQSLDRALRREKITGITQFVTTRFGNVLGSNGSVIPRFKEQILKGGPVTVTHPNIYRFFMLIPEACKLVLEAGTIGNSGEIFVFDMGKPVNIANLANLMIKLSGAKNIEIKFTGLRKGEKLYEEVLDQEENMLPTFHPKIKIARVRKYDYDQVCKDLDKLFAECNTYDNIKIVTAMKNIVPEYISSYLKSDKTDTTES